MASNGHCQPCSHSAISSARDWCGSSNSPSRMRSGFSPSVVRKFTQRDRMLPAMWRISTATLLASGSSVSCSCSSDSCAIALSASFLVFWNSSITTERIGDSVDMFDDQEHDRHRREPPRRRCDLAAAARYQVQHGVENEPPENTLRDGKGERNQDQRGKRRNGDLQPAEVD